MSSQIKNLKPRTNKEKIKHLGVLFFSLFLTLAVFSQIAPKATSDVALGWGNNLQPTTYNLASPAGGLKPSDWLYYKSSNDVTAYLGKKSSNLPTVRYQKNKDYLEFSMTGVSSTTSVSLETDVKTLNTPTLFYRNIFDGADANYQITNLPFKIKEEIVLKHPPAALERSYGGSASGGNNLTFLFSAETTGKPVKQKDGSIAFFGENGEYLFQLDKPFMVDAKDNRSESVSLDIKPIKVPKTKNTSEEMFFADSNLEWKSGLSPVIDKYTGIKTFVNSLYVKYVDNKKVLDLGGIEPPDSQVTNRSPHQVRPRTGLVYHKPKPNPHNLQPKNYTLTLSADSNWLSTATYPVIIDPTVTHNADANFTGQFNRIADSDTTTSTQLESSYPEATKDPYTVLLLHFNEANGTTAGIRDYASATRVITANGNASTTSYVTQLGLGNSAAFDGTGDYLSVPDSEDWNFGSGDFSIDFWVNPNSLNNEDSFFVQFQDSNNYLTVDWGVSGKVRFFVQEGGVNKVLYTLTDTQTWTNGEWYHFAIVRNGTSIYMYKDGVSQTLTATIPVSTYIIPNFTGSVWIGSLNVSPFYYLNANLDELRILKGRALTPEEIKAAASRRPYAVYTSPAVDATASVAWNTVNWTEGGVNTGNGEQPYNTNSLVAQWDFNDTSGTTLTASSSGSCTTACNGTLTNFASTASQDQAAGTGWTANNKKWGAGALMMGSAASADYVSITDPASNVLDPNSADLTIETWIKTSDTSAEIFSNNNANGTACTSNGYYLGIDANGYPVFYLDTNGATAGCDASITSQFKINDGGWHQVAVSVTRGTSAIIYVDGKSAGSDTSVTSYSATTVTGNVFFGGSAGGLDAILDSARFYSRALSAGEILSNYNVGNIEIQTRTGATSDPNDGTWEAWKPTTGETQLLSMDSDAANWRSDIMASTTIATSTETVIKTEGTGSLKIRTGMASTTANTVALWHFEETGTTTGATLYDETANNRDLTTTGTLPADGIFGKARRFNGSSDYATISSSGFPTGSASRTIMAWIKSEDCSNSACFVFGYGVNSAGQVFGAAGYPGGNWRFQGNGTGDLNTGVAFVQNKWHHIAVSYDGTTVRFYLNGIEIANGAKTLNTGGTVFHIGDSESDTTNKWKGIIDEMAILNRVLSPDEIAETYRMGANHHLTRQVSAVDLSSANKLAFNIASDRPGTYLDAMLGESDYANYELASSTLALSTTTVLYIKGDEIASSTSIKDSSFSGKAITANGNARTSGNGKIGNSLYFDGTGDYLEIANDGSLPLGSTARSFDMWIYTESSTSWGNTKGIFEYGTTVDLNRFGLRMNTYPNMLFYTNGNDLNFDTGLSQTGWFHLAIVYDGNTTVDFYINGVKKASKTLSGVLNTQSTILAIGNGRNDSTTNYYLGNLDEFRILKGTALTPDQIRQAYEYGLRSHPITIDFGATLQSSDLISNSTDYNFNITATTSGLSATTSGLYLGDKIIIKENLGGTEYTAQGTVNAINTSTGAITVPSWDTGSTFPASNGYSPNATVFKWQREYFDITGAATTTRNAITNLTLRPTNGAEGRTIYLDDFRYNTNYLTASSSSAITSSNNRYLQYRAVFTSWDSFVSPYLSAINTLYTALANSFPSLIGISGGGFLSF